MGPTDTDWDLVELCHHWDTAYRIMRTEDGRWIAQRRDDRSTVQADTATELYDAISRDYTARPVPR